MRISNLVPQITPGNTSFTCNYICKCNVNVNGGHWLTFTLHLQGLFRHLRVIGVNDGSQPFLTVAGVTAHKIGAGNSYISIFSFEGVRCDVS
jgi:hypothetical protein